MMSFRRLLTVVAVLGAAALTGCQTPRPASEAPTHVVAVTESRYDGYLTPQQSQRIEIELTDLAHPAGGMVAAGTPLASEDGLRRAAEATAAAEVYRGRLGVADAALKKLRAGSLEVRFSRDRAVGSTEVRAVEQEIEGALIAAERTALQEERDRAAAVDESEAAFRERDQKLARQERAAQLRGLFENLCSTSTAALAEAEGRASNLRTTAPWDGTLVVRDGEAWLSSTASDFIFVATEAQVEELSSAATLSLLVRGESVAQAALGTVVFDAEATANPQSPRYRMTFHLTTTASDFAPRERSTATLSRSGDELAIPADYLGHDAEGDYVLRDGVRVGVELAEDVSGQHTVRVGSLHPGDRLQQIGR